MPPAKVKEKEMNNDILKEKIRKADITQYKPTEFGMAGLFTDIFGEEIKHVILEKQYYVYKPKKGIWLKDEKEFVERCMERFLSEVCPRLVERIEDEGQRRKYNNWIDNHQSNTAVSSILKSVKRKPAIAVDGSEFDKLTRYFKLQNFVFDLELKECIPDNKDFLISKTAGVRYAPEVMDNTWHDFMMSIMDDDKEMYEYLLRMIWYAMQGNPIDHCMFMLLGTTARNGKSTFIKGLEAFFGQYETPLPPESLAKTGVSNGPSPDIVKLKGARLVSIAESAKNLQLNVALIKALTGMDKISARKLYSDYVDFVNQSVFFMHMNRLPRVDDPTLFGGERSIVIPFNVRFNKTNRDTRMPEKLITDNALSGLLNEVLRIQKKYDGVSIKEQIPQKVREATKEFEYKCDPIAHFKKEFFKKDEGTWIPMFEVYKRYVKFVSAMGITPVAQRSLTTELKNRGYDMIRRKKGWGIMGYTWRNKS